MERNDARAGIDGGRTRSVQAELSRASGRLDPAMSGRFPSPDPIDGGHVLHMPVGPGRDELTVCRRDFETVQPDREPGQIALLVTRPRLSVSVPLLPMLTIVLGANLADADLAAAAGAGPAIGVAPRAESCSERTEHPVQIIAQGAEQRTLVDQ